MEFLRPFSAEELLVQGEFGAGSVWNFEYEGGSFEVQFMFDSYNHFNCPSYPAHSHWKMIDGKAVEINWGKYGNYELEVDECCGLMTGNKKDDKSSWRKATFIRPLTPADLEKSSSHDHDHNH